MIYPIAYGMSYPPMRPAMAYGGLYRTPSLWLSETPSAPAISGTFSRGWQNQLKDLFHQRQAVVYALHLRTFAAKDRNQNGVIEPGRGENGNFIRAMQSGLLEDLAAKGVNTLYLLPVLPIGKMDRLGDFGSPGSVYAPVHYDRLNEEYNDPLNPLDVVSEARLFVERCHQLGIHVMMDVPSGASLDLAQTRPDLMARDAKGRLLTPATWVDLRAFVRDTPALRAYYQKFFDLMVNQVGVDGFRVDIARARTPDFWKHFISQYPHLAWLAESYIEEDATPLQHVPRDIPGDLMQAGFDALYGQFHIFHSMTADDYIRYLQTNQALLRRVGPQKSFIGSFLTHDDPPAMAQGGTLYCKLISGLMCTQPDTQPFILDGLMTGYHQPFDIFNWRPRPVGRNPEIGHFLTRMLALRGDSVYGPVLTQGRFIPLQVVRYGQDKKDPSLIAFLRQHQGKTLLVVANKNVNETHQGAIYLPGLGSNQRLVNLAPNYGEPSTFTVNPNYSPILGEIQMTVARGRFYVFELDLPMFYD